MRLQGSTALFTAIGMLCGTCHADFKYSETTKVTGGAMMGAVKIASVFSKNAKQAMAPTTRTVAIKGNKLREEQSDGKIQIIDLDNRRFIEQEINRRYSAAVLDAEQDRHHRVQPPLAEPVAMITLCPDISRGTEAIVPIPPGPRAAIARSAANNPSFSSFARSC